MPFDMGCYEILPSPTALNTAQPGLGTIYSGAVISPAEAPLIPLWGSEQGAVLVEQYQQYLQLLLQRQPYYMGGNSVSSHQGGFSLRDDLQADSALQQHLVLGAASEGLLQGHSDIEQPYMLASYLRSMSSSSPAGQALQLPPVQDQQQPPGLDSADSDDHSDEQQQQHMRHATKGLKGRIKGWAASLHGVGRAKGGMPNFLDRRSR